MDLSKCIRYILTFECEREYCYELAHVRDLLNLYLTGKDTVFGQRIYVRVRDDKYKANIDYYLTTPSIAKLHKRYYVQYVTLIFEDGFSHSTISIIDTKNKHWYYIDPNGKPEWYESVHRLLAHHIRYHVGQISAINMPDIGPQAITADSYCADWTMLLLYIITCSDTKPDRVIDILVKLGRKFNLRFLKKWNCLLNSLVSGLELDKLQRYITVIRLEYEHDLRDSLLELINDLIINHHLETAFSILRKHLISLHYNPDDYMSLPTLD